MTYATLFSRLKVADQYSMYIIEHDQVVVLYNTKRSLLLKGSNNVRLFSNLVDTARLSKIEATQQDYFKDLAPLVALLLKQNILEYVD